MPTERLFLKWPSLTSQPYERPFPVPSFEPRGSRRGRLANRGWEVGRTTESHGRHLRRPNGIAASPAGEWIYVADFATGAVLRAPWPTQRATLTRWALSPSGQADGIAVDAAGGVWVALGTGAGLARFHESGQLDRVMPVPSTFVSSLCFRPDAHEILITAADDLADPTAGGCVFITEVAESGAPLGRARTHITTEPPA